MPKLKPNMLKRKLKQTLPLSSEKQKRILEEKERKKEKQKRISINKIEMIISTLKKPKGKLVHYKDELLVGLRNEGIRSLQESHNTNKGIRYSICFDTRSKKRKVLARNLDHPF